MNRWTDNPSAFFLFVLIAFSVFVPQLRGQGTSGAQAAFTVEDLLGSRNINAIELSSDGRWAAVTVSSLVDRIGIDNSRFGDPTYIAPGLSEIWLIDTRTAQVEKPFGDKRQVRSLSWAPDGGRLAFLLRKENLFVPAIWERSGSKITFLDIPPGKVIADNTDLQWSPDGSKLYLALRSEKWHQEVSDRFRQQTAGPIVVQTSKEPFLAWEDLRRLSASRSVAAYDVQNNKVSEILPEGKIGPFVLSEDGTFLTYLEDITKKTDYDVIGGSENQIHLIPTAGGERRTLVKSTKGLNILWSRDRRTYAYAKEGNIFVASVDDKEPRQLTGKKTLEKRPETEKEPAPSVGEKPKPEPEKDAEKEKKEKENEKFAVVRVSPNGDKLVASNKEGLWLIDTASAAKELFLKVPEEDKEAPRYQFLVWGPDGSHLFLNYAARTKWERGLVRYDIKDKKLSDVFKDSRIYPTVNLSRDGRTFVFSSAEGNRPADLYAADTDFKNVRRLTDLNPEFKERALSRTELVKYLDADGNKTYGVLYYPSNYEPGKKYPTIFNIYEDFFDDNFSGGINVLTSNGYAVMQPSVTLETGYPGEAWVKGVTSAANKLIEMGVADPERLGVQGTSYGGYATNLLITQTNRFKAAVNISGKVNMISFYTDSPRLGVRNIHAPEKSQDRIGATLWQQPQKYIQHSAIMYADRIKTPLLLITGEQDHNVPARQAMEMYYALRRLGKEVEWVNYIKGGHGMPTSSIEEVKDYHNRIVKWYDDRLKGDLKKKGAEQKPEIP